MKSEHYDSQLRMTEMKAIIQTRRVNRNCIEYPNEIKNSVFWGLNHESLPGVFTANEIEEANAFTLHVDQVAVIPLSFYDLLRGWLKQPWRIDYLYKLVKFDQKIKNTNSSYWES